MFQTDFTYQTRADRGKYIVDKYQPLFAESVLDVGCSKERSIEKALPKGVSYVGVDLVPEADLQVNLEKQPLPFEDKSFRLVVCADVLEHLEHIQEVFEELIRVSNKYLIISLPNCWRAMWRVITSDMQFKKEGFGRTTWLNHYGLPTEPPADRHRWFFNASDAQSFVEGFAEKHGLTILQMDKEPNIVFEELVGTFFEQVYGITPPNVQPSFLKDADKFIEDMTAGTLWVALEKKS